MIPESELTYEGAMHAISHLEELEEREWPGEPLLHCMTLRQYITRLENLAIAVEADPHIKTAEVWLALGKVNRGIAKTD